MFVTLFLFDIEDEINKTKIFPNPTNSLIQINCKIHTLKSISLYSIDGKLVNSWENINQSTFEIDIKKLSSGIYILKIINDLNKASHHKIIKNWLQQLQQLPVRHKCLNTKLQDAAAMKAYIDNATALQQMEVIAKIDNPAEKASAYKKVFGDCCASDVIVPQ